MGEALGLGAARSILEHNPGCQRDTFLRTKGSLPSPHWDPQDLPIPHGSPQPSLVCAKRLKDPFAPRAPQALSALHSSPSILDPGAWSRQRDFQTWACHHFPGGWWLWVSPVVPVVCGEGCSNASWAGADRAGSQDRAPLASCLRLSVPHWSG